MELLEIEQHFLGLQSVKDALNLTEISRANRSIANAQKKKFSHTLTMATLVKKAVDFYDSEEGKTLFAEEGIEWSKADLGLKVFGWQKSYFYKVVKVGNLDERIVTAFQTKCDNGSNNDRSLANLLRFAQDVDLDNLDLPEDATEEEIVEAEAEAIESAEVDNNRIETTFTMSYKREEGNIAVRMTEDGEFHTRNSKEDIIEIMRLMIETIENA